MRRSAKILFALTGVFVVVAAGHAPATAACKKMGFLVNDYGKEGPTKDAQLLLDKHIAAWADEQGINEYSVGKKTVKCELYLDLIFFDEHTCTASATVCWGGSRQPREQTAKAKSKKKLKTKQAKSEKRDSTSDKSADKKQAAAEATKPNKKSPVVKTVKAKTEDVTPGKTTADVETSAISNKSPEVPYAKGAVIRNAGSSTDKPAELTAKAPAQEPQAAAILSERAAADRAAAAAERAAAAAERAAAAAQKAAEAAKQAAAAQTATVPPIEAAQTP